MDTSADTLLKLREQILEQTVPLLDGDDIPIDERFRLTLQIAQTKGSYEFYEKAFRLAQSMEGEDKLDAYLDLLSQVDAQIQQQNSQQPEEQTESDTDENQDGQG
jgi:hypothetical protein